MECEFVQKQLALNQLEPDVREGVNAHVASCDRCKSAALLFSGINDALAQEPVWHPPEGFAASVAAVAAPVPAPTRIRTRFTVAASAAAILCSVLFLFLNRALFQMFSAVFEYYVLLASRVSRVFVANAVFLLWVSAVIFVIITVRLTRRSLAGE